jgi:hypothetical protein
VVLNTNDYDWITTLLRAPTYRRLPKDPSEGVEGKITLFLEKLSLSEDVIEELRPQAS